MATIKTMGIDDVGFYLNHTVTASGEKKFLLETENHFIDKNVSITITTPAATAPTLSVNDITTGLSMGTASSGVYSPTITVTGNAVVGTAGWITSGNHTVTDSGVKVGTVNQSTMMNGGVAVASGSTIIPTDSNQTITISEGYNAARTIIVGSSSTGSEATITSGSATITAVSHAYDSTNDYFTLTGSADVSAPTISVPGYISTTAGTKNANAGGAVLNTTVDKIILNSSLSGTTTALKPTLSKQAISISGVSDAASGNAQTIAPATGAYVAIRSVENVATIISAPSVSTAGYGTTSNFGVGTAATATVGAAQSDIYYVPIKAGTITSGSATISAATYTYNSSSGKFDVTGSTNVSAPTYTEGYISTNVGTKNANIDGATLSTTVNKIGIQANLSGTGTKTPSITKNSATNMTAAGTATTTQPDSGYYIAVSSAANTGTVQATASVSSAGYGTTTSGQYTTTPSSSLTVGAAASAVTYVPVTQTTFANAGTSGTTYTDISSTGPVLVSGDYLYINAGYTPDVKISLARLVPDASGDNAPASYILNGYTAYDNDGTLIIGTMQTYTGIYADI